MKSILACAILLAAGQTALAQTCCDHCGCRTSCRKVCRVVCEVQKVPKVVYDCECEEFCLPGPSVRTTECDECGHKHHVYTPTCGKLQTRTKMIKRTEFEEKVVYKWVVENVCCDCGDKSKDASDDADPVAAAAEDQPIGTVRAASHRARSRRANAVPPEPVKSHANDPAKISIHRLLEPLVGRQ